MIVVDASAIVAIMTREPDGLDLARRLDMSPHETGMRAVSTVSLWEAACAVARITRVSRTRALELVQRFCHLADIEPIAPDMEITARAIDAAERYGSGEGRPGILNMGDCFSYATARHLDAALLFKGDDFARTNIEPA